MDYEEASKLLEEQISSSERWCGVLSAIPGTENDVRRIREDIKLKRAILEFVAISDMYQRELRDVMAPDLSSSDHRHSRKRQIFMGIFAWIEAHNYQLRQIALAAQGGNINARFEPAELMLLEEQRYALNEDTGKAVVRSNQFLKALPNTRFTFHMFAKAFGFSWELQVGSQPWKDFRMAYNVRNSLAHPKAPGALLVPDDEVDRLIRVAKWYGEQLNSVVTEARRITEAKAEERNKRFEEIRRHYLEEVGIIFRGLETLNRASAIIEFGSRTPDPDEATLEEWRMTHSNIEELKAWMLKQLPEKFRPPRLA